MPVRARPRRETDGGNSFLQTGTICGVFRRRSRRGRRHTPDFSQSSARHSAVCALRLHGWQAHLRRVRAERGGVCGLGAPACTARSGRLHLPKSAIRETAAGQCGGRHASGSPFPYGLFGDRAGRETHPFKAAFCAIRRNWPRAPRGGTGGCGCRSGLPLRGWPAGRR